MRRHVFAATLTLAGLAAAGTSHAQSAAAASRADPMHAARIQTVTISPTDPMLALVPSATTPEGAAEGGNPEFGGLPDAPGAEDTYYQCVACHSTEIIKQQRLTEARWDYLWDWMVKEQGMVEPDPETKAVILSYLKAQFSAAP